MGAGSRGPAGGPLGVGSTAQAQVGSARQEGAPLAVLRCSSSACIRRPQAQQLSLTPTWPRPPAADYQSWEKVDPATLFDAPTLKSEANPKARVCRHLQQEAKGCDYLVGRCARCAVLGRAVCRVLLRVACLQCLQGNNGCMRSGAGSTCQPCVRCRLAARVGRGASTPPSPMRFACAGAVAGLRPRGGEHMLRCAAWLIGRLPARPGPAPSQRSPCPACALQGMLPPLPQR